MTTRILVVEDSTRIAALLQQGLSEEGHEVAVEYDGEQGFQRALHERFDAAVVDVMLPGRSGIDLVQGLRDASNPLPVLLLTARDQTEDKILGLDAGADDYLTKPFELAELSARVRAMLRRSAGSGPVLRLGEIELEPATRQVRRAGASVDLTPREFALLEFLLRNPNRALSRAMIMQQVWDIHFDPGTNVVDVFINALRTKLDPDRNHIQTVRGVGYRMVEPEATPQ
jgi:DNA-binding response OmpR family regulator